MYEANSIGVYFVIYSEEIIRAQTLCCHQIGTKQWVIGKNCVSIKFSIDQNINIVFSQLFSQTHHSVPITDLLKCTFGRQVKKIKKIYLTEI